VKREYGALVERKCQESPEILGEPLPLPPLHRGFIWNSVPFTSNARRENVLKSI